MTAWITASISIRRASAPAIMTMVPYCPANQPAVRSGLVVFSTRPPTLPVTHTAALVTQAVTPRITNSPASAATFVTAPATASQTFPTTGNWQGLGTENPAPTDAASIWASGALPLGPTLMVNSRCDFFGVHQLAEGGSWSLSSTQNDQLPCCVGVPLTTPFDASERPGGTEPLRMVNWYGSAGPQPPSPLNWWK